MRKHCYISNMQVKQVDMSSSWETLLVKRESKRKVNNNISTSLKHRISEQAAIKELLPVSQFTQNKKP